ncbi:MAG TPA: hypothetical protein VGM39_09100 [Kofleriaceae bacterium]
MTRYALLLTLALSACQGGKDMNITPGGDDAPGPDAGMTPDGSTPATLQCSHTRVLDSYPWGVAAAAYIADQGLTFGIYANGTQAPTQRLQLEVWPGPGGAAPTLPRTTSFDPTSKYSTCTDCMLIGEGCDAQNNCTTWYFPQAGHVTVGEASRNADVGNLHAAGSGLIFAEWSMQGDKPVPDGRCIQLNTYLFDSEWGGDGGTCSGDSCSSSNPCCSDSPYCTLGNNSIGRFCSDICGESGDGCTGPNDCCDGFKCFLGTCISDTCGGNDCTAGLDEGGGCCETAPYCTGGRCGGVCGSSGETCGGDMDCCTGLSCSGGTCH